MPLTKFICPDKEEIKIEECLENCRLSDRTRCPHISILRKIAEGRRPWVGIPSVTQLLNGTYQSFLEITEDYAINPDENVFSVLGTGVHSLLEQDNERLTAHGFSGLPDFYDRKEETLIDFKVSGSYKVAAVLGNIIGKNPQEEIFDWTMQLNAYRLLLMNAGLPVKRMYIHAIVRDGGTFMAKKRGIDTRTVWIPINELPDDNVLLYMKGSRAGLFKALEVGGFPKCLPKETWDGMKCKEFCPVRKHCKYND